MKANCRVSGLSGTLKAPFGYMGFEGVCNTVRVYDGHEVVKGKLKGITLEHSVPEHWIVKKR